MNPPAKRSRSLLFPAFILIFLAAGVLWFFFNRDTSLHPPQDPAISEALQADPASTYAPDTSESLSSSPLPGEESTRDEAGALNEQIESSILPTLPGKDELTVAAQEILAFYHYLDQQEYIRAAQLGAPSHIYFTRLIQKLLDSPPTVLRETDELLTILKNSAHFFRVLGKDNILLLKEILSREKDTIEKVVANYALVIEHAEPLDNDLTLTIPDNAMYEYSCFFLNTMGGRLYLARRTSLSRMLVSYYALQFVDLANTQEKNIYGLNLQPSIDMLTADIETGGNQLHYKESYLDTLYDLKEKYQ